MIRLDNISVVYPGFALRDVDLHIKKGDFFALIGPTGSGKSVLLEAVAGLAPTTGGRLTLRGRDVTNLPAEKRNLGMVYQDYALFPHLSVKSNILYGTRYHGLGRSQAAGKLDALVATLGLERILSRKPVNLSGGEKQRVALARALILDPGAVLLDEPLSALDPVYQEEIKELLKSVHRELDVTVVMVSHNFSDVLYLANRGAVIKDGLIRQTGDIDEIFDRPDSPFTAHFVGMKNLFPASFSGDTAHIGQAPGLAVHLARTPGRGHTHLAIRPEDVALPANEANGYDNRYEGTVTGISSLGNFFTIHLECAGLAFKAVCSRNRIRNQGLEPGNQTRFCFHAASVHTFGGGANRD